PSEDPDSERVWWEDAGVHQNLTFPVQPDPVSGQHCWHQKVTVTRPEADDRYGDVVVDTNRSFEAYREWLARTRPAPRPGNLRRPLGLPRGFKPAPSAYQREGGVRRRPASTGRAGVLRSQVAGVPRIPAARCAGTRRGPACRRASEPRRSGLPAR